MINPPHRHQMWILSITFLICLSPLLRFYVTVRCSRRNSRSRPWYLYTTLGGVFYVPLLCVLCSHLRCRMFYRSILFFLAFPSFIKLSDNHRFGRTFHLKFVTKCRSSYIESYYIQPLNHWFFVLNWLVTHNVTYYTIKVTKSNILKLINWHIVQVK